MSTRIEGPEIQVMGTQGGFHQIKVQYIYTENDGHQYRRGCVLLVSPESMPIVGMHWELPHKKVEWDL